MTQDETLTLSVADVAKATGVSESSVRRSIRDGSMPAIRIRSRVMVLSQPFLDSILLALGDPDAVKEAREDAAAEAENQRLSAVHNKAERKTAAALVTADTNHRNRTTQTRFA